MNQTQIMQKMKYHKKQYQKYEDILINWKTDKQDTRWASAEEKKVIDSICKENGILPELLYEWYRYKEYTRARYEIARYFRNKNYALERISYLMWYKSHASILYLFKKYEKSNP